MSELNNINISNHNTNGSETSVEAPGSDHDSGSEQGEGALHQSQHSNSSGSSISGRCSICWEPLREVATAFPCGHKFDLVCIRRWTSDGNNQRTSNTCPVCRNPITELRHSFDDEGSFQSEVVGMSEGFREVRLTEEGQRMLALMAAQIVERERALREREYGRQDPGDEDVTPEMSAREIHDADERRRLRNTEVQDPRAFVAVYLDLEFNEEHQLPGVKREIRLQIRQSHMVTSTILIRAITIRTNGLLEKIDADLPAFLEDEAANSHLKEYRKAMCEIRKSLGQSSLGLNFVSAGIHLASPVSAFSRNISCAMISEVGCDVKAPRDDENLSEIIMSWDNTLREEGPAFVDGDDDNAPEPMPDSKQTVDTIHKQFTEEIQGVLENVERTQPRVELDRATTNIREPHIQTHCCSYCQAAHRNGDCLLINFDWQIFRRADHNTL